ncbi:MAG TPA: FAD-dependent monooxygenase, partial [Burkholderiaceae bacterium]|nr:FAD-dependent monooxygenase [Burkholderiaceae bacterium]
MNQRADIQVLVVGAGPTGLMLANQLARFGVRVAIIDRHAGPARETRALGVHARTLEIYSQLGLTRRAIELGRPAVGVNLWTSGRRPAVRIPLGDIGSELSPYPFVLILGQDDNEKLLGELLGRQGVAVRWNTELVGLELRAGHVRARLRRPDGTIDELDAAWVAGCDGARSAVREANAIPFEGAPYEHVFFVADARLAGPLVAGELNVFLRDEGFHLFFPMRGSDHWRVVGILPPRLRGRDGLDFEQVFPSVREQIGLDLRLSACSWFSSYRIHHRRAARFREHRCFVLGDAAHIHSPVGAQGMNTGLQDAYNLGWKLALVCSGRAGETLLDTYHEERWPVAGRLLETTDRAFSLVISDGTVARLLRTRVLAQVLALAMRLRPVRELAFRTVSQIGIAYRGSRLSTDSAELPTAAPR